MISTPSPFVIDQLDVVFRLLFLVLKIPSFKYRYVV